MKRYNLQIVNRLMIMDYDGLLRISPLKLCQIAYLDIDQNTIGAMVRVVVTKLSDRLKKYTINHYLSFIF